MSTTAAKTSSRDPQIDLIRGLCVLIMLVDHLPDSPLQSLTYRPFGLFTAAPVFVFLSGYVAGWRLSLQALAGSWKAARVSLARRIVILMVLHHAIATLLAVAAALAPRSETLGRILPQYIDSPWNAWMSEMIWVNRTVYLDLLTMYVLLLPILLVVIPMFQRGKAARVLAFSGCLWLGVQFDLMPDIAERLSRFCIMNLLAWQLLMVTGAWLGYRRSQGLSFSFTSHPAWKACVIAVCAGGLLLRYWPGFAAHVADEQPGLCVHLLQWVPLLNFAAAAAACSMIPAGWRARVTNALFPVVTAGRHALALFVMHFAICYLVWFGYAGVQTHQMNPVEPYLLPILAVASILLSAEILEMRRRSRAEARRQPESNERAMARATA